jgi:uncharacterized Tic20 family protein
MSSSFTGPPPAAPDYVATPDERNWGMLSHISSLIAIWLGGLAFLGPLIVWLVKKDQSPFVADQAKEALNFQIAVLIVNMICAITCVGLILVPVIFVADIVFSLLAGIEANKGIYYRYPYTFRLIA